ncbi:MAG: metal-binding protein [Pseudanabaena frigida]|uniref:Metal-binding protein n=1 Tax=Pseudanabaena frigida TaxID=945775 RepID=A0A2W4W2Y1_9CYAN|nr:MAG: metal-binding protein [Pseudanabaena frigida]
MEKLHIPQIARAVDATESFEFKEFIEGLDTLTPVQGVISVNHAGSFIEVTSKASTIITLTCDRTLVQFNYRLAIDTSEMILLAEAIPESEYQKEREIETDELVESLPPNGYFDPSAWLYEQLVLAIPYPKIAPDAPALELTDTNSNLNLEDSVDKRWAVLSSLQLSE